MNIKKHVGKIASTEARCIVVQLQIPTKEDHALVIPVDGLPPRFEQAVMEVVESTEGQAEVDLINVLHRRLMPDTGKTVLTALHESGLLKPVPVSNILMLPRPHMPIPLENILVELRRHVPVSNEPKFADAAIQKYNPHIANQKAENVEHATKIAQNLLLEAEFLLADAKKIADEKRNKAYAMAPHLRNQQNVNFALSSESAALDSILSEQKDIKIKSSIKTTAKRKKPEVN